MAYSPKFDEALVFASQLHRDQVRKASTTPYINHLLAVAALVGEAGGSETEVIAALLHDAVEDQGGAETRERIFRRFGQAVVDIVDGCTDTDQFPKPPWKARKEAFIHSLQSASASVLLVCAADKLHNCRSIHVDLMRIGDEVWSRFNGKREGTLWYYRSVAEVLKQRQVGVLADQLMQVVEQMSQQAQSNFRNDDAD